MRALLWGLTTLLPALAHADILQFDFTGALFGETGFFTDTFQVSFLANTNSGSLRDTFSSGCLGAFSASLPIYDVNVIADGKQVMHNGAGGFALAGGAPVVCGFFTDEPLSISASAGRTSLSLGGGFDQIFPNNSQSAILGAKDPLALILNPSFYGGVSIVTCNVPGLPPPKNLPEGCGASGHATTVPEPDALGLFAAGALSLLLFGNKWGRQRSALAKSVASNVARLPLPLIRWAASGVGASTLWLADREGRLTKRLSRP